MLIGIDVSRANSKERTGVEEYAFQIAIHLAEFLPKDANVFLYSREPLIEELDKSLPSLWKRKVLKWPPKYLWTLIRLSLEMFFSPVDCLFVPAHVLPLFLPKKTVMVIHDFSCSERTSAYSFFQRAYSKWSVKRALKKSSAVIAPSSYAAKQLDIFSFSEKINIVPHGVDEFFFAARDRENISRIKEKYGLRLPYVFFTGRIEDKKNLLTLIQAMEILREEKKMNIDLVLAGKPGFGYEKFTQARTASLVSESVKEIGWVPREDLPCLMAGADVFAFPGAHEGFGLPILEAMAAGTPVVAAGSGANPETGGDAALYFEPRDAKGLADAIGKLIFDRDAREQKISAGRIRAKSFSWKKSAEAAARIILAEIAKHQ